MTLGAGGSTSTSVDLPAERGYLLFPVFLAAASRAAAASR